MVFVVLVVVVDGSVGIGGIGGGVGISGGICGTSGGSGSSHGGIGGIYDGCIGGGGVDGVSIDGFGGAFRIILVGKSDIDERYENNIEEGGQGSINGDEGNKSEEKEESEKEDDDQHDDNLSLMGRELISKSQHEAVKTISIDRFQVAMLIDDPAELTSDLVLKCQLEKPFDNLGIL
ncbi:hypothetical protein FXO38_32625 [Capsicum annuum]|nr:hypothetical protein FXO38_32625 [Capsicum annuum]